MPNIKVLHFSTHNEDCGIGKYQEMFLAAMEPYEEIENAFFDVSPNVTKVMPRTELLATVKRLGEELEQYDILHVQHEFSFFSHDELDLITQTAKQRNKKLIITLHTSPNVAYKKAIRGGLGPRSWLNYSRDLRVEKRFFRNFVEPVKRADLVLVHNAVTRDAIVGLGVHPDRIGSITIPVPKLSFATKSSTIRENLQVQPGDVVYCTTGFLHKFKGTMEAIKALSYLPANYKLAIIGGMHPFSDQVDFYDKVTDLVRDLGLIDRVFITGYIKDDDQLNAAIRECDICVYPYEKVYYSNVSSAALNNALANYKPTIAYPTATFVELNTLSNALTLTDSFSYYELAREIKRIDLKDAAERAKKHAIKYSYTDQAASLVDIYESLLK